MSINKLETKLDHKTLHVLPFLPSRKRQKGFHLQRQWKNLIVDITAFETLNTYDLMTLLFITKEYVANGYKAGYIGEEDDKREVAGITIPVKQFLAERGILNKKVNRETLKKSIQRLKTIYLVFTNTTTKRETHTSYIYEFKVDDKISEIKVYANKKFIDFIIDNGILVNIERLMLYGDKEQYAILLDLYLQGTKKVTYVNKRKILKYKERYTNKEIEIALKLDLTKMRSSDKREIIRNAFKLLKEKGNLPEYIYNKNRDTWERTDLFEKRHQKIK